MISWPVGFVDALRHRFGIEAAAPASGRYHATFRVNLPPGTEPIDIRVPSRTWLRDPELLAIFEREVRILQGLSHPNIATVLHHGRLATVPYYAVPASLGPTLQEIVFDHGPLGVKDLLILLRDVATALAHCHDKGVLHRDLNPLNVRWTGRAAILDGFSAAALAAWWQGDPRRGLDVEPMLGNPTYMSPEQVRRQPLDGRSDLYGLGMTAYVAMVGDLPFHATRAHDLPLMVLRELPRAPAFTSSAEASLYAVLGRLFAKDPEARYRSAGQVLEVLGRWAM